MEKQIIDKLIEIKNEYLSIQNELMNSKNHLDINKIKLLNKSEKKLRFKMELFDKWNNILQEIKDAEEIISIESDQIMINELKEMISFNKKELENLEEKIIKSMINKNPDNERDVIVEIQGAVGGDEAKIFVGDLFKMYQRYAAKMEYDIEIIDEYESETGGYSNISFYVRGIEVYGHLKFESGVHRVQRVPATETLGRIHTSTVIVSVIPEVEEIDVEINPSDIRIDTYRSGGKGGQHANKTDSAVRITHIPTGIVAQSQDGRSQHHNKDIAMQLLRSRIYEIHIREEEEKNASMKKNLVGSGDRSEKIRTYNYPQNRITDHRIGLTLKKLDRVMEGSLSEIIDVLISVSIENK